MAKKVMSDLITKGYVVRSWLGVYIQNVDDNVENELKICERDVSILSDIIDESHAEKFGL